MSWSYRVEKVYIISPVMYIMRRQFHFDLPLYEVKWLVMYCL